MEFIFLILSLLALWLGTEILIKGALNIAQYYNFSHVFIGLTILAVGTDLPEVVLSVKASLKSQQGIDASGVVIGNVLGSAISQISLVMGISGLVGYFTLTRKQLLGEGLIMMFSILLTVLVLFDNHISKIEGYTLIIAYMLYYISLLRLEKVTQKIQVSHGKIWPNFIYLIIGGVLVIFSSDLVVEYALILADKWEVNQTFVSILILGLGTSLPELAISLNAALKGSGGLSVGNLIGSNIFDLLIPVGVGAAIYPIQIGFVPLLPDFILLFVVSGLVLLFFNKKKGLQRKEAVALIIIYLVYASYKVAQTKF